MLKSTLLKYLEYIPVILILFIFILPLCKPGLIVGGDWTFPSTNIQLKEYSHQASSIWSNREIPTGTQVSNRNAFMFSLLAGLWSGVGLDGVSFQKAILFSSIFGMYWSCYLFLFYLTKHKQASVVGAMSYLFSPLVFNYLNMGWINVLFFMALAPLYAISSSEYLKYGGFRKISTLGLLSVLAFSQSQAIIWFPIIFTSIYIYQVDPKNIKNQIPRFLSGIIVPSIIVLIANAPWIITSQYVENSLIKATSNFDLNRFSSVFSLLNSIRGWGSLYNLQFEISYPPILLLITFFPFCLIIFSAIKNNINKHQRLIYLSLSLILVAPMVYIFRGSIARLPFSSIIRDSSRFTVLSTLGFSIGISVALSKIKNKTYFFIVLLGLFLYAYPYFSGKLFYIRGAEYSGYSGTDFRVRLLDIPISEIEKGIENNSDQVNLIFPTGGSFKTTKDNRFKQAYWEVYDPMTSFSPFSSGIYISDKSSARVMNITSILRESASHSAVLRGLLGIYGVNNIYNRSSLKSEINLPSAKEGSQSFCEENDNQGSEWGITEVCPIQDAYPMIYTPTTLVYSSKNILDISKTVDFSKEMTVTIGCPDFYGRNSVECGPSTPYGLAKKNPQIQFRKESDTRYIVDVDEVKGSFLLVLNKTYHPEWRILDKNGKQLKFDHLLVNQLVNGWVIRPELLQTSAQYVIEFYPQKVYSQLYPLSVIFFLWLSYFVISGLVKKK